MCQIKTITKNLRSIIDNCGSVYVIVNITSKAGKAGIWLDDAANFIENDQKNSKTCQANWKSWQGMRIFFSECQFSLNSRYVHALADQTIHSLLGITQY